MMNQKNHTLMLQVLKTQSWKVNLQYLIFQLRHPPDDERIAVTVDILVEDGWFIHCLANT